MGAFFSFFEDEEIKECDVSENILKEKCNYVSGTGDDAIKEVCQAGSYYISPNVCLDHINGCNENLDTKLTEICKFGDNKTCEAGNYYYDNSCYTEP